MLAFEFGFLKTFYKTAAVATCSCRLPIDCNTVFSLINAEGVYKLLNKFGAACIGGRRVKEGGVYFAVKLLTSSGAKV